MSIESWFRRIRTVYITRMKLYTTKFWPFQSAPDTFFVILCQPRTGSTLLYTLLNSHTAIYSYGEVLRKKIESGTAINLNTTVFRKHPHQIRAVGLKVFYDYLFNTSYKKHCEVILKNKSIKVIHLVRNEQLDSFLSLKKAELSQVWSSTREIEPQTKSTVLPGKEEFISFLEENRLHRQNIEKHFAEHQRLDVSYEALTNNREETLMVIQQFLSVKPKNLFSLLKKQAPNHFDLPNYEELDSVYQHYKQSHQF